MSNGVGVCVVVICVGVLPNVMERANARKTNGRVKLRSRERLGVFHSSLALIRRDFLLFHFDIAGTVRAATIIVRTMQGSHGPEMS